MLGVRLIVAAGLLVTSLYAGPFVGQWRTIAADRLDFAQPGFDDASWRPVSAPPQYPEVNQVLWFRARVAGPRPGENAVLVPPIFGAYQLYADGVLIGQRGAWGRHPRFLLPSSEVFPLSVPQRGDLLVALRVYPCNSNIGSINRFFEYSSQRWAWLSLEEGRGIVDREIKTRGWKVLISILVVGIATGFAFFVFHLWGQVRDPLQGWFCGWVFSGIILMTNDALGMLGLYELWTLQMIQRLISMPLIWCQLEFICAFIGVRPPAVIRCYQWLSVLSMAWGLLSQSVTPFAFSLLGGIILMLGPMSALILVLEYRRKESRQMAIGAIPVIAVIIWIGILPAQPVPVASAGPKIYFDYVFLAMAWLIYQMSIWLGERAAQSFRAQSRLNEELATAARIQSGSMQGAQGPGWQAHYHPWQEVGGDFYYARRTTSGLVVVIGDASGKGLPAALVVSELLGALRSWTDAEFSPSQVLSRLNQLLLDRQAQEFVTACCVSLTSHSLQVSCAGHIPPYSNAFPLEVPGSLPLGILPDVQYPQFSFPPGPFVLLTDGVAEATSPTGELFGFARISSILHSDPASLASAAIAWGQRDDITVVEVSHA
jgi:phosphoserine phosphatase RsbU/P